MMKEVLTRRFQRLLKEDPDREGGRLARPSADRRRRGAGQCAVAGILGDLGVDDIAMVIGVAKGIDRDAGKEEFHRPGQRCPSRCATYDAGPLLRAAPARRSAPLRHRRPPGEAGEGGQSATPLDEIPGVGAATRKRALLAHFGSAKAVSAGGGRGPEGRRWHFGNHGARHLRFLPRAGVRGRQDAASRPCSLRPRKISTISDRWSSSQSAMSSSCSRLSVSASAASRSPSISAVQISTS
jgi:hypothetical protein